MGDSDDLFDEPSKAVKSTQNLSPEEKEQRGVSLRNYEKLVEPIRAVDSFKKSALGALPRDLTDPSSRGLALNWVKNLMLSDRDNFRLYANIFNIHTQEAVANLKYWLEKFFQMNRFIVQDKRDLNRVKDAEELGLVVKAATNDYEEYQAKKLHADAEVGTEFLGEDDTFKVYIARNKGAACELGKGTQWCTSAPGLDFFNQYYKENDPLFVFINKQDPKEKYQFSYGSQQFMNKEDERVDDSVFLQLDELLRYLIAKTDSSEKYPTVFKDREEDGFPARNRDFYDIGL
jgi:hypothetical protein